MVLHRNIAFYNLKLGYEPTTTAYIQNQALATKLQRVFFFFISLFMALRTCQLSTKKNTYNIKYKHCHRLVKVTKFQRPALHTDGVLATTLA